MTSAPLTPLPTRWMRSPSKAAFELLEEVDLGALAQLVGGLASRASAACPASLAAVCELEDLVPSRRARGFLLALQVLGLAQQALLGLGHALLDRRLLVSFSAVICCSTLSLASSACARRAWMSVSFGERSLLGLRLDGLPLGGNAFAGGGIRLGLGLLEGGRLLLAQPRLDLAGDVLGDRLVAGGAAVAGGVRMRLDLLAARRLEQAHGYPPSANSMTDGQPAPYRELRGTFVLSMFLLCSRATLMLSYPRACRGCGPRAGV